ncbi:FKBP-type peptidyl-prolyl cis-trans isomerase [Membranihabitans marinus]|uniref:FKBP-type peptidyl-prolyl cis-trans isomerase n=1 Tax=Membranihabitans marinus TaxID=1227546 RepID=UPI001F028998|nr:FKBP-type peptidyl-prolyl cis-trans isomerase [Membranihabitans marinus]
MIQNITSYLIFGLILLISCNSNPSTTEEKGITETQEELSEDENIRLAMLLKSSPQTYIDVQYNDLIEYAIEKQWPVQASPSGLLYWVEKEGRAVQWTDTSTFQAHYTGNLLDDKVFDSSFSRNRASTFRLDEVIPAWQEAVRWIGEGGVIKILATSNHGYGNRSISDDIKPYTPLIFDLEVIKVE